MVKNTETILIEALQLPVHERTALASRLLASLDEQVDEGVDAAWGEELAKRLKEIDEGKVKMVPGEQVMQEMRRITRGEPTDGDSV
jgi:putative addiction module component (TIGR02574 family)